MSTHDTPSAPQFIDWSELPEAPAQDALAGAIASADWDNFTATRDLPDLRARLAHLARTEGIGELHRRCTEKLRERGAELRHRFGHTEPHVGYALSPDGRYLATGTWVGADYDAGGSLQVWEVGTGRLVNVLPGVQGGVGWPGFPGCVQWSPTGEALGAAFLTNTIGDFEPFGTSSKPDTWVGPTNGWSRPPAWCWRPDGDAFAVGCWGDSPIPGCIATLDQKHVNEADVRWFAADISLDLGDDDAKSPALEPQTWLRFSTDGRRLLGHNDHEQAFAVDLASGQLAWLAQIGEHAAWSPDNELLAHDIAGLVFYDAETGLPTTRLPMHMGASELSWSPDADARRLAMVVEPGNKYGADPAVHLYDAGEFVGTIEVTPAAPGDAWEFEDARLWAWAPDRQRGACLTADATVELWTTGAEPERLGTLEISHKTAGILWGAENTLVCIGKELVEFWDIDAGSLRATYDHAAAVAAYGELVDDVPRPLETSDGADLGARFRIDPTFALGEADSASWVTALPQGIVICAESLQDRLADELCWVVDNRFSWPLDWGEPPVYGDLDTALDADDLPFEDDDLEALGHTARPEPIERKTELDLGSTATLDDLFEAHRDSLEQLPSEWKSSADDHYREVALMRAERGEVELAQACAERMRSPYHAMAGNAELAVAFAHRGEKQAAAHSLEVAEKHAEHVLEDRATALNCAPLAAANHLLGNEERAAELFELARRNLSDEANRFQRYLALARGCMAIGDFEAADEAIRLGPWEAGWLSKFLIAYIVELAEHGQFDRVEATLDRCEDAGMDLSDFALADGLVEAFVEAGEFERAWNLLERFGRLSVTQYRRRIVDALEQAGRHEAAAAKRASIDDEAGSRRNRGRSDHLQTAIAWAKRAAASGDLDTRDQLFERARAIALDGSRDPRFALADVQRAQIEVGDLEGAYKTLRKQTPTNRVYEADNLIRACAEAGEFGAVIQLLEQLPSESINDRPQKALRAIRIAVHGSTGRPVW